jgi:putative thiamine transport system permease protein
VVDVALVTGPASPPTLAVLAWQWLQDADALENAKGAAAAWLLAGTVAASAALVWALMHAPLWRHRCTRGVAAQPAHRSKAVFNPLPLAPVYLLVLAALLLGSLTGPWPFPQIWPTAWTATAWHSVAQSSPTVWATVALGVTSASCALLWAVAWLELAPLRWHRRMQTLVYAPLLLPALLWVLGLHRLALAWGLDGSATGVWLAHWLACLPYVLLTLQGAYMGFDRRLYGVAATLGHGRWHFVWRIKWPLLRASLASAFAVGFAVSVAQYLSTLYVGAGRFATVTTEAVTLASGGQRSLMAAFAWLQWLLPALVFGSAAWLGRGRRFNPARSRLGTIQT